MKALKQTLSWHPLSQAWASWYINLQCNASARQRAICLPRLHSTLTLVVVLLKASSAHTASCTLTLGSLHHILDFFDEPLDLLAGALQLLLVPLQVLPELGAVRKALGELERLQAHAHRHPLALALRSLTVTTPCTFTERAPAPASRPAVSHSLPLDGFTCDQTKLTTSHYFITLHYWAKRIKTMIWVPSDWRLMRSCQIVSLV